MNVIVGGKDFELSNPLYKLDSTFFDQIQGEIAKRKVGRYALRRRIVFLMDGYKYGAAAVEKRWGIGVNFFEAGHELVKSVYFDSLMNEEGADLWWRKMNEEKSFMKDLADEVYGMVEIEKLLINSIPQREINSKEAEECLLAFLDYWIKFCGPAFLWFSIDLIKERIDEEIKASFGGAKEEAEDFISKVYRPTNHTRSSKEQRELLDIGKLSGDAREAAIKKHWQEYSHLAMHDSIGDTPFSIEDFRERLKISDQEEEYKKAYDALDSADKEMKQADQLLKNSKLPETLKEKIQFVRSFMFIRTETIDYMTFVFFTYKSVFESIAKILSLSVDNVLSMTFEEIISSLREGKLTISRDLVLERTDHGYAFLIAPGGSYLVTGDEIDKLLGIIDKDKNKERPSSVKGQVAFPGKVTGRARVIIDSQKANELQEGEILITTMTNPSFVPAMKRSAGMITNEGGVLCHAAIMSRELRKPCIIATKFATDVFKTEDMVELDATAGTAKKIVE